MTVREAQGGRVRLVLCEGENFKVTTAADLALAEQLLTGSSELKASGV